MEAPIILTYCDKVLSAVVVAHPSVYNTVELSEKLNIPHDQFSSILNVLVAKGFIFISSGKAGITNFHHKVEGAAFIMQDSLVSEWERKQMPQAAIQNSGVLVQGNNNQSFLDTHLDHVITHMVTEIPAAKDNKDNIIAWYNKGWLKSLIWPLITAIIVGAVTFFIKTFFAS